jgi:hypothetical protein
VNMMQRDREGVTAKPIKGINRIKRVAAHVLRECGLLALTGFAKQRAEVKLIHCSCVLQVRSLTRSR